MHLPCRNITFRALTNLYCRAFAINCKSMASSFFSLKNLKSSRKAINKDVCCGFLSYGEVRKILIISYTYSLALYLMNSTLTVRLSLFGVSSCMPPSLSIIEALLFNPSFKIISILYSKLYNFSKMFSH